jgi:hypothetical protein
VEEIFSKTTREESLAVIDQYSKFWMSIPGTRGAIGKKTVNASTHFNALFDVEETTVEEDSELDETKLEELEDEQLHGATR